MEKLNTWNFGDEGGSFHFLSVVLDDDIVDTRGHWEEGNVAFVSMVFPCEVGLSWAIYLHVQFTCESKVKNQKISTKYIVLKHGKTRNDTLYIFVILVGQWSPKIMSNGYTANINIQFGLVYFECTGIYNFLQNIICEIYNYTYNY